MGQSDGSYDRALHAALTRLLDAIDGRYSTTMTGDTDALHYRPEAFDELLAAVAAADALIERGRS